MRNTHIHSSRAIPRHKVRDREGAGTFYLVAGFSAVVGAGAGFFGFLSLFGDAGLPGAGTFTLKLMAVLFVVLGAAAGGWIAAKIWPEQI